MHCENVYATRAPDRLSWFRPQLDISLSFSARAASSPTAEIIDVGGGESTLVDDLLSRGYANLTVLDICRNAIGVTKARLGVAADHVGWRVTDITKANLPASAYGVWHDRAVFHFLTAASDRASYVEQAKQSLKPGGHPHHRHVRSPGTHAMQRPGCPPL
jgi:2-polyprenyl-3-methyl-5-hydroxy-6-metoxy-1,4-benzoquinol methylase